MTQTITKKLESQSIDLLFDDSITAADLDMDEANFAFLRALDAKTRSPGKMEDPRCRYRPRELLDVPDYHNDYTLSAKDLNKAISIHQQSIKDATDATYLLFHPHNTSFGFTPGYSFKLVTFTGEETRDAYNILTFRNDNLPKNWDFNRLCGIFSDSMNKRLVLYAGLEYGERESRFNY